MRKAYDPTESPLDKNHTLKALEKQGQSPKGCIRHEGILLHPLPEARPGARRASEWLV
jgi:hypothetical protein